jgi:hypothetical protein
VTTAVVSVYKVANFPDGGGHFWVYMQYAQGLRRMGCDVYWLEQIHPPGDPELEGRLLSTFFERMKRFGFEGKTLLYTADRRRKDANSLHFIGCSWRDAAAVLRRADLLLNFHYAIDGRLLACARRTALVDIDPGLLQFWIGAGQLDVPPHDRYLTTGETVGTPAARFPDCGLPWIHIRPPVCLDHWPFIYDPSAEAFTTVSSWASTDYLKLTEDGVTVLRENTKRVAFLEFADLPRHTSRRLELALYLLDEEAGREGAAGRVVEQAEKDAADRAWLERHGWRIRHSRDVAGNPEAYRDYIQRSRGEFSCVKPSCVAFQNAWVSDRSLCYLASGKPVVVQHTGPSAYLPDGEGMFRFQSRDDAIAAFEEIDRHYERHCRAAREIAEDRFDSKRTLETVLNATLGSDARAAGYHLSQ